MAGGARMGVGLRLLNISPVGSRRACSGGRWRPSTVRTHERRDRCDATALAGPQAALCDSLDTAALVRHACRPDLFTLLFVGIHDDAVEVHTGRHHLAFEEGTQAQ